MDASHRSLLISKKLVVGMCFAAASMCAAGIVEIVRQDKCPDATKLHRGVNDSIIFSDISNATASELSIYAQVPQSLLIGFSQLFGMIGGYEYAFFAAPRSGQSLFMSFYFCSIGMSFLIGTVYFNLFPKSDIYIDFQVSTSICVFINRTIFFRYSSVEKITNGTGVFTLISSILPVYN